VVTKKISFSAKRPSTQPAGNLDEWVLGREGANEEPTKRLTIEISLGLHKRVKSRCAIENLVMADVIREFLEQRFPVREDADKRLPS